MIRHQTAAIMTALALGLTACGTPAQRYTAECSEMLGIDRNDPRYADCMLNREAVELQKSEMLMNNLMRAGAVLSAFQTVPPQPNANIILWVPR